MGANCCKKDQMEHQTVNCGKQKKPKTRKQKSCQMAGDNGFNYTAIQVMNAKRLKVLLDTNSSYNINNKYTHNFRLKSNLL